MAWMNYAYAYLTSKSEKEEGQGMVEYGLIIALVALIAAAGFLLLGESIGDFMGDLTDRFTDAGGA